MIFQLNETYNAITELRYFDLEMKPENDITQV